MNYDNKHTDKKLRELEHQSLPDLSKMDENWQQMGLLLQPGAASHTSGKTIFRKKILLVIMSVAAVLAVSFFVYQNTRDNKDHRSKTIAVNKTITPVDSPMLLKARTSDGRDTVIGVINVNRDEKPVKSRFMMERAYEQLQKKPQRFIINNQLDTVINGKEGTRLFIPANSFDTKEDLTLLLTEFYSINDMIVNKLTTTCDGRRLVTGGMIYLDARTKNDHLVDLKNGASLRLDIPKQDNQQPMELFYGFDHYRNDVTTVMDSINWKRTKQLFNDGSANNSQPVLIGNFPKKAKRDSLVRVTSRERSDIGLDYTVQDTTSERQSYTVKGDSIVLQRYGVNIKQLGWINCDRFGPDTKSNTELIVDLGDDPRGYYTLLVFDNIASIMSPSMIRANTVHFTGLPLGEPVRIISLGTRNNKLVTAMHKVTISGKPVTNLNFEEVSPLAFKKKLDQ